MKISNLNRVYTKLRIDENKTISLGYEHLNYLQNVLRLKAGRQFRIFNETDGEFIASIKAFEKKDVIINIASLIRRPAFRGSLALALSIIKPDKMFDAINMAVQLGITEITPIIAERSQGKVINIERLSKIIIEAVEQSERLSVPKFNAPITLDKFIESVNYEMIIYANENESSSNLMNDFKRLPENLAYLVGPEGGFALNELQILQSSVKTCSISLGENILRAETAVAAGIAQIQLMRNINAKS